MQAVIEFTLNKTITYKTNNYLFILIKKVTQGIKLKKTLFIRYS